MSRLLKAWRPLAPFLGANRADEGDGVAKKIALIVLNQPVMRAGFQQLWSHSTLRVCADGGANRLFDAVHTKECIPDYVVGDLDSVRPDVREYYTAKVIYRLSFPCTSLLAYLGRPIPTYILSRSSRL